MKEEMMKKNREEMLTKFNKEIEDIKSNKNQGICIYCK